MAKFELKFIDCLRDENFIKINFYEDLEGYYKHIIEISGNDGENTFAIWFDKSTAIKFAKTLRTEINKITEIEAESNE